MCVCTQNNTNPRVLLYQTGEFCLGSVNLASKCGNAEVKYSLMKYKHLLKLILGEKNTAIIILLLLLFKLISVTERIWKFLFLLSCYICI